MVPPVAVSGPPGDADLVGRADANRPREFAQVAALTANASQITESIDDAQFEALITATLTNGCRGFLFRSDSPLDAPDAAARHRAALLEQWNDRLDLIEPWLTIGKQVGDATSTDASTVGVVLQAERSRLLVPTATSSPKADATTPASKIAFVVPGIPVSNESFLLSPTGCSALASTRVAGGTRIEVPRDFDGYILITEDPAAITGFRQRIARVRVALPKFNTGLRRPALAPWPRRPPSCIASESARNNSTRQLATQTPS